MAGEPSISFITPTLDAAATLPRALSSIAGQPIPLESIVVDGGSRDGTPEIAATYEGTRVVSAPGSSIYEAINTGLNLARAPIIGLLNADDALASTASLEKVRTMFAHDPSIDIVRGLPRFSEITADGKMRRSVAIERRAQVPLSLDLILDGPIAINSMFFRRSVFERLGRFDTSFRLAADREWLLRAWLGGAAFKEIGEYVYEYLVHEGSSTLDPDRRNFELIRREHLAIARRYLEDRASAGQPRAARHILRRWHAIETIRLGRHLLRQGRNQDFRRALRDAFATDRGLAFTATTASLRLGALHAFPQGKRPQKP
jgi:glycosyltransferase involved in cell wall biosynthesis